MGLYRVTLSNGDKIEVTAPNWMVLPVVARKEYRKKHPEAKESEMGVADIEPLAEVNDMHAYTLPQEEEKGQKL